MSDHTEALPRKTMLFNPYTGRPRDPRDIASDPGGLLIVDPDAPLLAARQAAKPAPAEPVALDVTLDETSAAALRSLIGYDGEACPVRLQVGPGHDGFGLYASSAEYPDEGAVLLSRLAAPPATPAAQPAAQAGDALPLPARLEAARQMGWRQGWGAAIAQQAATPTPPVKYVPVDSMLRDEHYRHPNDDEQCTPECGDALDRRGDDEGQGLDGYWKWGFKAGWNACAERQAATPAPAGSATSDAEMMLRRIVRRHRNGKPLVLDEEWLAVEQIATRNASPMRAAATPAPAEPVGYVTQAMLDWMTEPGRSGGAFVATEIHRKPCMDAKVPLYAAPPATPAAQPVDLTGTPLNDACWSFVNAMPHQLPGPIWNDLKPAVKAAIERYLAATPAAQPAEWAITAPDGRRWTGPTPFKAASAAADATREPATPEQQAAFAALVQKHEADMLADHEHLNCPACGGSGHVEDAQRPGFVLVPVEPTEAMHAAAVRTIVRCNGNDDFPPRIWRAMLAAAPAAPSEGSQG